MERSSLNSVDSALLDLEVWPRINEDLIDDPVLRDTVERRCRAIRLFVDGAPRDRIASETGISARMALYWLQRCLKIHPDGRIYGFRILLPYTHSEPYRRVAEVTRTFRNILSLPKEISISQGSISVSFPVTEPIRGAQLLHELSLAMVNDWATFPRLAASGPGISDGDLLDNFLEDLEQQKNRAISVHRPLGGR